MSSMDLFVSWSLKGFSSCVLSVRLFWHHCIVFLLLWRNNPVIVTVGLLHGENCSCFLVNYAGSFLGAGSACGCAHTF